MSNILIVVPRNPYPPTDGALLVIHERINTLIKNGHSVTCFVIKEKSNSTKINTLPNYNLIFSISKNRIFDVILNTIFYGLPPLVSYYFNKSVYSELQKIIKKNKYDFVLFEHLHLSFYGKLLKNKFPKIIFLLFHHNIESDLYYSFAKKSNIFYKPYFYLNGIMTEKYESLIYKFFDTNIFISENDLMKAKFLSSIDFKSIFLNPSINLQKYKPIDHISTDERNYINLGFIGSMDYKPNIDAVNWFLNHVIPKLNTNNINYKFYVVGKNPPSYFNKYLNDNRIHITGWVDSDIYYYNKMDLIISPIFSGAGVKIKVLNALACGKVLIANSKAVEGISGLINNKNFILANCVDSFYKQIELFSFDTKNKKYQMLRANSRKYMKEYCLESEKKLSNLFHKESNT